MELHLELHGGRAAPPQEVTLDFDSERNEGTLRWKPNPLGTKPAKYRIYASDEKGFSISDEPFTAVVGSSRDVPAQRPGNFIAQVPDERAAVIGADSRLANRAFYRVVAVDENGNRSGPSDFAEAPWPILCSRPVTEANVGAEYRYALSAIRSLGDLRMRDIDGKQTLSYWDVETPRFELEQGPSWLKVQPDTGLVSGVPDKAGKVDVVVSATIDRTVRRLDPSQLSWGVEKTVATSTERVGVARQKFTIVIAR